MSAAMLLGFCVLIVAVFGAPSMPKAMADATITLAQAKQQLAKLQSTTDALELRIQRSEDTINEALVQQASIEQDIVTQQAMIDGLTPTFATIVNAQKQSNQWGETIQFLLDDDTDQFLENMGVVQSVNQVWTQQLELLCEQQTQLNRLNTSLTDTVKSVSDEQQAQKDLLVQAEAEQQKYSQLLSTLTSAEQQAVGSPAKTMKPQTLNLIEVINKLYPEIKTIYTLRKGDHGDHGNGLAADFMLPNPYRHNEALGWAIAHYIQQHAQELDIQYVIFHQTIWNISRASEGWRAMANRGGDTANHIDHVHVSLVV